jgi:Tol biopolymer transport system component
MTISTGLKALLITLALLFSLENDVAQERHGDLLIYKTGLYTEPQPLTLYDPRAKTHTPLFDGIAVGAFSFSATGMLAFAAQPEGDSEVYIWDVHAPDNPPINISRNSERQDYPLSWSPDGRYLAFEADDGQRDFVFVWDSKSPDLSSVEILETDTVHGFDAAWSPRGQLAISVAYIYDDHDEIYLWDQNTTMNLSQSPDRDERRPMWSVDGRLAFLSRLDADHYDILVWDGTTFKNGLPDKETFLNVASGLPLQWSNPTWTTDGLLAFEGYGDGNAMTQIYLWNGEASLDISRIPDQHNGLAEWAADGRWAFVNFFSAEQFLYVRDADNNTLLKVQAQYRPAWSLNGLLMYCVWGWTLSVWDGQHIDEIVQANDIQAQWQGGDHVTCSFG